MRIADEAAQWIVAEADLRQAVLAVVAVVPAGLAVIFLHGASVNVIAPANAVELRQTVLRELLSRTFKR